MISIKRAYWIFAVFAGVGLANVSNQINAQEASSVSQTDTSRAFASQLWDYLLSNNYKHWSPAPGNEAGHYSSTHTRLLDTRPSVHQRQIRHGGFIKSYVNRNAASSAKLPIGSIIILENYLADKSLESISVMYKTEGFNPSANDWYWVKFNPDGSVAKTSTAAGSIEGQTLVNSTGLQVTHAARANTNTSGRNQNNSILSGRIDSCIRCHQTAQGGDLVFFNDQKIIATRTSERIADGEIKR